MSMHTRHQIELLRPHQIKEALAKRSLVYLPLGTIEWHCEHLPVGLDALTASELCLRAAGITGGLVFPPLYYGTGGGHGSFPWTIMMDDGGEIDALLEKTLSRIQDMGVERLVILSGHFADEQLLLIDQIAQRWRAADTTLEVIATAVSRVEHTGFKPDHAGVFETTLLHGLRPETVVLDRLPKPDPAKADLPWDCPDSEIWGVYGPDPREADLRKSQQLVSDTVAWLTNLAEA